LSSACIWEDLFLIDNDAMISQKRQKKKKNFICPVVTIRLHDRLACLHAM